VIAHATSQPTVGKLTIRVEDPPDLRRVYLCIPHDGECITLPGTTVCEPRPGWINLQVPAIEVWQPALSRLPHVQPQRIQQVEVFVLPQREVAKRLPKPESGSESPQRSPANVLRVPLLDKRISVAPESGNGCPASRYARHPRRMPLPNFPQAVKIMPRNFPHFSMCDSPVV